MAKSSKVTTTTKRVFVKDGLQLVLDTHFVYEVDIYKLTKMSSNLEDSRYIASKQYVKNKVDYFTKDGIQFRRSSTLAAAPETWLNQNKFTELCLDPVKQPK